MWKKLKMFQNVAKKKKTTYFVEFDQINGRCCLHTYIYLHSVTETKNITRNFSTLLIAWNQLKNSQVHRESNVVSEWLL